MINIENKTDKHLRRMCVDHWKRMLKLSVADIKAEKEFMSDENCAFCNKYYYYFCRDCPVYNTTQRMSCKDTPFVPAANLYIEIREGSHRKLETFYKAVQKEIDFLESLEC